MMRRGIVLLMLLPLLLCGCFEVKQQIVVNTDGGGRIIERFAMSKIMLKHMNEIFASLPSAKESKAKPIDLYDVKELKQDAKNYGPGVTYLTSRRVQTATKEGYEVEYAFKDINAVRIDQNPDDKSPKSGGTKASKKNEPITFRFQKGNPAKLTVLFPKEQTKPKKRKHSKTAKKTKEQQTREAKELRQIFEDFYIGITVRPEGTIVSTDATYNEDGTITLLEMNFKELLANDKQFKNFIEKEPDTIEEAKELLKNVRGFKIEPERTITIAFE